ncbi:hypothetical protein WJX72_003419 [[Myrmecia] bisecta]|uniref:Ribokinase n=1 Tax=[Myrmecia] bisecta TaxID=41462 RepID=A0AAW1PGX7_9CHLO
MLQRTGETISASTLNVYPGGKGANQAAAAGKLGYPTYFLGQVGQDAHAGLLRNALEDSGVDISCLRAVDGPSGSAVILLQPSGENSIIIVGGANMSQWELVDEGRQLLQSAGGILLQREIPEEVNIMVAQVAKEAGVPVLLDCGGMEGPISEDLLKLLSVLSPNETELARMTGKPTESDSEVEAAARQLLEQGVDTVLVKRGSQGSMLVTGRDNIKQPIFKVDKVIDTTGAGDCYTGAYSVAVLEGMEPAEALQFAAAAASVCIQRQGAMPSLPRREEVTSALQEPQ